MNELALTRPECTCGHSAEHHGINASGYMIVPGQSSCDIPDCHTPCWSYTQEAPVHPPFPPPFE